MKKIVLTGAAGRLGSYLREPLTKLCDALVSTDIKDAPLARSTLARPTCRPILADFAAMVKGHRRR